jgi:hypothetical protein
MDHLLTTFGIAEDDSDGRGQIKTALSGAGVGIDRALPFLQPDEEVHLSTRDMNAIETTPAVGGNGGGRLPPVGISTVADGNPGAVPLNAERPVRRRRSWLFWLPTTLLALVLLGGLAVGAFLVGQGTRLSDPQVAHRVAHRAAADQLTQTLALSAQRTGLKKAFFKRLRKQKENSFAAGQSAGYSSGQSAGYSSGQSAGYSSGHSQGKAEGTTQGKAQGQAEGQAQGFSEGFDQGTCYDPVDFTYVC